MWSFCDDGNVLEMHYFVNMLKDTETHTYFRTVTFIVSISYLSEKVKMKMHLKVLMLCVVVPVCAHCSGHPPGACQSRRCKRRRFDPWVRKMPWKRAWQPTPVFLPGESPWTEEPGGLQFMGQ